MTTKASYRFRTTAERDAYIALVNGGEAGLKAADPVWAIDMLNNWCDAGIARVTRKDFRIPSDTNPRGYTCDYHETWQGYRKYTTLPVGR